MAAPRPRTLSEQQYSDRKLRASIRRARPATDPLNAAINFLIGLLEREVARGIAGAGLHPGFGFLHRAADGNAALA